MFTEMMMSASGGGGGTLQETSATQGSKITWTATTPSDLNVKNYVLSGTFYVNSNVNAGDTILTVSNPPKQDTPCYIFLSPSYGSSRRCTLKSNGALILDTGESSMNAGYSWTIGQISQGHFEYAV